MNRFLTFTLWLAAVACGPLQAACLREPAIAYPYGDPRPGSVGTAGVAYLFANMGGIPAKPVLSNPVDGTVLDGGMLYTGMVIQAPDPGGRSSRAPLEMRFSTPVSTPMIAYAPYAVIARLPDTTHYKICAFEAGNEADCERTATAPDSRGYVVFENRCEVSNIYFPPNGALSGFTPTDSSRVTELFWKVRACNRNRQYCSGWSDKKSLKWLPAPVLLSDGNSTQRGSQRANTPKLVASAVRGGEKTYFCLARPGDRCTEKPNYSHNRHNSPSPLVRNTERHDEASAEEILWPQLDYDSNNNPIDLQSWFDNQTVNWTASACITLPNTNNALGCVYQEQTRSVSFPP